MLGYCKAGWGWNSATEVWKPQGTTVNKQEDIRKVQESQALALLIKFQYRTREQNEKLCFKHYRLVSGFPPLQMDHSCTICSWSQTQPCITSPGLMVRALSWLRQHGQLCHFFSSHRTCYILQLLWLYPNKRVIHMQKDDLKSEVPEKESTSEFPSRWPWAGKQEAQERLGLPTHPLPSTPDWLVYSSPC